jgi:6-phosphogluconolactonase
MQRISALISISLLLPALSIVARGQGSRLQEALRPSGPSYYLLVGTYTNTGTLPGAPRLDSTGSKGIYVYRFDATTGHASLLSHTEGVCNPSFLTIAPDGHHIYAVTDSRMTGAGTVSAFDLDRAGGKLTFINKVPSGGDNPAYVAIDPSGQFAAVANYTGGSFSVFALQKDGGLQPFVQNGQHFGHGVNPSRQDKPHVHSAVYSPDGRYLYIQDLGLDQISILPFHPQEIAPAAIGGLPIAASSTRSLTVDEQSWSKRPASTIHTVPGAGPRHLTFAPSGEYAYLVEEMGGMVDVYHNPDNGRLDSLQRIAAHPDTARGPFRSADIHVSPDGKYLYVTNRAESTIAIFSVDKSSGTLHLAGYQSVFGQEPRNFTLDPTGRWLLVANQESKEIVVFRVHRTTGLLTPVDARISVPAPTCLRLLP